MQENSNIEILAQNNPFLMTGITNETIGEYFPIDPSAFTIGDVVCMTPLYYELLSRFGTYENAKKIYQYAREKIVGAGFSSIGPDSIPYLNFTIYLEQEMVDNGILTPYIESWVPGKKYHVGDAVYYSIDGTADGMKVYILENCPARYDTYEISKEAYEENVEFNSGNGSKYSEEGGKYYIEVPYYSGYYDENTHLIYFDELNSNTGEINLKHWKENIEIVDGEKVISSAQIDGATESVLRNVMRKKTDMDASGNTLPFILHYNVVPVSRRSQYTKRVLDTTTT